jgi:hypothetical protein
LYFKEVLWYLLLTIIMIPKGIMEKQTLQVILLIGVICYWLWLINYVNKK